MNVLTCLLPFIGVVNMSFPLSDQPVFGEWFIFVEVQGHTYNKSFEVQKYGEDLYCWDIHLQFHIAIFIFFVLKNTYFSNLILKKISFIWAEEFF